MSSTPRPSYAERERERLRRFELKRSRSRSKVPGRGRGRPRLSDAELTKRCQQAQHVRRAREARQEQQRQAALPHGDAAWQARYQAAHAIAANAAPRPSYCSPEARDLLLTLADVLLENFETCPLALRSDRVVVGAYAAHADRERFRAATRCDGLTLDGVRCRLTSAHQGPTPHRCAAAARDASTTSRTSSRGRSARATRREAGAAASSAPPATKRLSRCASASRSADGTPHSGCVLCTAPA